MREELLKLINEYKETKSSLNSGLEWMPDNESAKSKIDIINMVVEDLENIIK
ncbi:hypothetical protein [Clostridium sp.]|uniref:hypothetical protein n=1 Tax=Clostridium sp. TaxID=1506 RepID=UPI002A9182C3|nr:hypothetical protein [Clostridium sp.]MDY6011686.1 hypothetical protein [Clostridium sp.]